MTKLRSIKIICLATFLASCGSNSPEPTRDYGSNLLHQSFVEISENEFFISQESATKILTADTSRIELSAKLPINSNFSKILGNKSTLFLQTKQGVQILKKKDNAQTYEIITTLEQIKSCDMLALGENFLAVASGNTECSSATPEINFYNISDPAKPAYILGVKTNAPVSVQAFKRLIFLAEGSKGFRILEFDGTNKPTEAYKSENKAVNHIFYNDEKKTLVLENDAEILQYNVKDITKPVLLSTIQIGK
jgi:hypothetical protein